MYPASPEFSKHSENFAAVKQSLVQVERGHKQAIRSGNAVTVDTYRRMHLLTIGVLAEAALRKIVTDPSGFNDRERELIWNARSQADRWLATVDLAFRRHYRVLVHQEITAPFVPTSTVDRYEELRSLLRDDLAPVIEDRNKIAHAQWKWQLKSRKENEFKDAPAPPLPNYSSLTSQARLIEIIAKLVYVLVVSEPTFDRDYANLGKQLDENRATLDGVGYESFIATLSRTKLAAIS